MERDGRECVVRLARGTTTRRSSLRVLSGRHSQRSAFGGLARPAADSWAYRLKLGFAEASPAGGYKRGIQEVESLLESLSKCLTIEDGLDESHALAYHQNEEAGSLTRSPLGRLVTEAKYRRSRDPRERIGEAVIRFIESHPRYARVGLIASVPSHDEGGAAGLSGRLVKQVADSLDLKRVVLSRTRTTPEQKDIIDDDRVQGVKKRLANQRRSMVVSEDLQGESVILIDDLYGSGGTMQEATRAMRAAGATEVLGLCVTKQRLFGGVRLMRDM